MYNDQVPLVEELGDLRRQMPFKDNEISNLKQQLQQTRDAQQNL